MRKKDVFIAIVIKLILPTDWKNLFAFFSRQSDGRKNKDNDENVFLKQMPSRMYLGNVAFWLVKKWYLVLAHTLIL